MIGRREFITLLGGAAAVWPLAAGAQQAAMPVIGFLQGSAPKDVAYLADGFRQGLSEAGYVEGRNVQIEYRWAEGQYDRLPAMAADLVNRHVNVIAALGAPAAVPAKAATKTIPMVFYLGEDPIEFGLVASFNRPEGNVTGVANLGVALVPKRLQLLHELVPQARSIAILLNPRNPNAETNSNAVQDAARLLDQKVEILNAGSATDLEAAFAMLAEMKAGGVVIGPDAFFNGQLEHLARLAIRYSIPTIFGQPEFVKAGGLMSYGASTREGWRQTGIYTGRILKGEKPIDLPITQPTKFELMINLKTAKALGLTIPAILQATADEVIE
jgi:putative ABC transport system substrate-binding protein